MATESQWESIPDVEEQTELDNPIKIRWSGRDRARVRRGLVAAYEDGYIEKAIAVPVVMRQKTQIVIKTEEELDAFKDELAYKAKWRVERRITDEIEEKLNGDDEDESEIPEDVQRRYDETDMDALMEEIVIPHARKWVNDVWPGGTVDVDSIDFFWNPQLTNSAGKAYKGSAVPESMASGYYAIGLAPDYYYQHGLDELLAVVRHELIHQWEYQHPDGGDGGHGPKFKQWIDDMDTHRHCKLWSKKYSFSISD
jgi:hypothetical protein